MNRERPSPAAVIIWLVVAACIVAPFVRECRPEHETTTHGRGGDVR